MHNFDEWDELETESEFGGPFDFVGDALDAIGDVASSVWDRIPGSKLLNDAVKAVVNGPLKAFAETGVGEFLLNAMAANLGGAAMFIAGPVLGPALLVSSAAIPGIAAGGDFGESLAKGWAWRLETAAQIVGPMVAAKFGDMVGDAARKAVDEARKLFPNLNAKQAFDLLAANGIDAEAELLKLPEKSRRAAEEWAIKKAGELGTTPAALLQAVDLNSGTQYFDMERWNLETGQLKGPLVDGSKGVIKSLGKLKKPVIKSFGKAKAPGEGAYPVSTVCEQYAAMKATGKASPAILEALRKKCEAEKAARAPFVNLIKSSAIQQAIKSPISKSVGTLAASVAVSNAEAAPAATDQNVATQNNAITQQAQKAVDSKSTKLGVVAGVAGAALGTGVSMLAGLSAVVAAPIGIGFGVGSGIATKLLTRK